MNAQQLIRYMDVNGVPYVINGARLRVMDTSQLPGAMRDLLDERGFYLSEKVVAAEEAKTNAEAVQADADKQMKAARATGEEAALDAAKAQTEAIRDILPMGETEREMTTIGLLNPTGDTKVPAHLESHAPQTPKPTADADDDETKNQANQKHLRGPLPDGFPGKAAFEAAGYTTFAKVRAVRKAGTKVDGVGDATNAAVDEIFAGEDQ
jgi:hypothetical protein